MVSTAEYATGIKSIVGENACGEVTGFPHLANGEDGLVVIDFTEAVTEFKQRNIFRTGHGLACCGGSRTHVDDLLAGIGKFIDGQKHAIAHVRRGESSDVDDVFGAAKWRSVGEFQVHEVFDGETAAQGGGEDIESFVDAIFAYGLRAEEAATFGRPKNFQCNGL